MESQNPQVKELFDKFEDKMEKTVSSLEKDFLGLKAGRANAHMLDKISVDYYGTQTPLSQVSNITVPEARVLVISVYDISILKDVEKAIVVANIGLTPNNDGKVIRLIFPELTTDRRKDLVKTIKASSEGSKVVLRNARRDINDVIKKMKKDSVISENDCAIYEKKIDKLLADKIECIDKITKDKEIEVLSV